MIIKDIKTQNSTIFLNLTYYSLYPLYFNRRYKTKFLQIKCKMFFFLIALLEACTTLNSLNSIKLIKYNSSKFIKNKFTFPRAPYKNKLSQITIGQQFYKLRLYIQLINFKKNNNKSLYNDISNKILMLNSPMLTLQNIHITIPYYLIF